MNCPACEHPLTQLQAGQLTVDACVDGCGGIWFDNFELKRLDQLAETELEALLNIEFSLDVEVDYQRRRSCPKCEGIVMMRHFFNEQRRVQVDSCPKCGGIWLDAGELAEIRRESASKEDRHAAAQRYFAEVFRQDFLRTQARGRGLDAPGA